MGLTYDGSIKEGLTGRLAAPSRPSDRKNWLKMREPKATNCLEVGGHLNQKHREGDSLRRIPKTTPIEN